MDSTGKHLLIIEDEKDLSTILSEELTVNNYQCQCSDNFNDALGRLGRQKYSAIILDLRINKTKSSHDETPLDPNLVPLGLEIIQRLRDDRKHINHRTPIIVASGYLDPSILRSIAPQIQGALVKPYEMSKVLEVINKVITSNP